jgi:hypothetical protein
MARMIERPPVHDIVRQVYWPAVAALPESDTHGPVRPVVEPDKRAVTCCCGFDGYARSGCWPVG